MANISRAFAIFFFFHSQQFNDMMGELYLKQEMPEPPKESFFKGLFGGGTRSFDREELCEYFDLCLKKKGKHNKSMILP